MVLTDIIIKAYRPLIWHKYLPFWILTPVRRLIRTLANLTMPRILSHSLKRKEKMTVPVIVSFTSFPARINNAWQVVECMLRQTYLPSKIILWLSRDQFKNIRIPDSLLSRENSIFEIKYVEGDIRSHKKYLYAAKDYPQSLIFLIDDDLYYSSDIIEKTYIAYSKNPDCVVANYGYFIGYKNDGKLLPYNSWRPCYKENKGVELFFGSGGGTLFNPQLLYYDLTNINLALDLTPLADDIWLNAMCNLNNTPILIINNGNLLPIKNKNNVTLSNENKGSSKNDDQIEKVIAHYRSKEGKMVFVNFN